LFSNAGPSAASHPTYAPHVFAGTEDAEADERTDDCDAAEAEERTDDIAAEEDAAEDERPALEDEEEDRSELLDDEDRKGQEIAAPASLGAVRNKEPTNASPKKKRMPTPNDRDEDG